MKIKVNRKDLLTNDDIWNAVLTAYGEYHFPTENDVVNEVFIVFSYFCELESGGHESLLNWLSWHIEDVGITSYLNNLTGILEKIDAHDYADIEKKYGEELWRLFKALENQEIAEDDFYNVIEKADKEYIKLNEKLGELLQSYSVSIYTELIEVIED
ncbi:hypothetical protein [Litchfieldia alkalitelluris]|uniref:hypothetical protein n=1 Tax=Litchfieldia alkalitelluris TaxID=304268 RepID=UPI000996103E|nr:hypothetical protein [Litchfieldia alkalitelluris]